MEKPKALLIGDGLDLMFALPSLLSRSGFVVDVIASSSSLKKSRFITNLRVAKKYYDLAAELVDQNLDDYQLVVVCDDWVLKHILESDLTLEKKLKILPVISEKNFSHLFSKIGLSKTLSQESITTPDFLIAKNIADALSAAQKLGYPVMVKANSSNGGRGVFECFDANNINAISSQIFDSPVVVQKKINGIEFDLSAFYRDGKLIYFSYSKIEKVIFNKFGPSVLRTYHQLGNIEHSVFSELQKLGKALGANGFVTISAIKSQEDGKIYFIEADMRPNTWVEMTRFIGDDPAIKIANWFSKGETLNYPQPLNPNYPMQLRIPYFLRLSWWEITINRYNVWKYLPTEDMELLIDLMLTRIFPIKKVICKIERRIEKIVQFLLPIPRKIKRLPTTLIRIALPEKEDRIKVKAQIRKIMLLDV